MPQEHYASALAVRRLQMLIAASPAPTRTERIVLACPPGEQHTISLQVSNLFLRRQGWEVIDLGANVPLERLETMVASLRPQLLIASAQHLPTAQTLRSLAVVLARVRVPFAFGGGIFNRLPTLPQRIPGHFLGEDLSGLANAVQAILHAPWSLPNVLEPSPEYVSTLEQYRVQQLAIEAEVLSMLQPQARDMIWQAGANTYLAQYLNAALALGDINLLDSDLSWVRGLLSTHQLPDAALQGYLQVYLTAVQKHLNRKGELIVNWFREALADLSELDEA